MAATPKFWAAGDDITSDSLNKTGIGLRAIAQSTPDMTLYVMPGVVVIAGVVAKYAGGNSGSFSAPSSNPRIDLLCINNAGTLSITQGSEAASPSAPAYPTDKLVICEVYMRPSTTAIHNTDQGSHGYIYLDSRPLVLGAANPNIVEIEAGATLAANDAVFIEDSSTSDTTEQQASTATNNDGNQAFGITTTDGRSGKRSAEKMTPSSTFICTKIAAYLRKQGSPGDNVVISIQADSAGVPSGVALASGTVAGSSLSSANSNQFTITLNTPVTLNSGTPYWIVFSRSGSVSNTDYYRNSSGAYSGSTFYVESSGGSWTLGSDMKTTNVILYSTTATGKLYKTKADTSGMYEAFAGFVVANTNAGSTAKVTTAGVHDGFSGLSPGKVYYLSNTAGAVAQSAGSNTRKVGIALSATKMLITNIW